MSNNMQKYKKYLGYVVNGLTIEGLQTYYDMSSGRMDYAFTFKEHTVAVNCELFIMKYFS